MPQCGRQATQPVRSRNGSAARPPTPLPATPTSVAPSPPTPGEVEDVRALDGRALQSGAYYGRTNADVCFKEMNCRKAMVAKLKNGSLSNPHIIDFTKYAARRHEQEHPGSSAYMMTGQPGPAEDERIMAVLDTGCNNTCHGDRWMLKYMEKTLASTPSPRLQMETSKGLEGE